MKEIDTDDYSRVQRAIAFIEQYCENQPSLEDVAAQVELSPHYFQKVFSEWVGVSPKKFLQCLTLNHAKWLLREGERNLFNTAVDLGLSGTGRLHDLFVKFEAMSPGEYKNGGQNLVIKYKTYSTIFGEVLIASTSKGVCLLHFTERDSRELDIIKAEFPKAEIVNEGAELHQSALRVLDVRTEDIPMVKLHIRGTSFQIKVWEGLLQIPSGKLKSYGDLAEGIGKNSASRAVGTAVGQNPVAFIIPCHRVVRATGAISGYRWGERRKKILLTYEAARYSIK